MAKKKITLETLAAQMQKGFASVETRMTKMDGRFDHLDTTIERGFAAVAEDISDIKRDMATKDQIITLHTQVASIETQLRDINHTKLQARVADLEEEIFGKSRV